MSLTIQDPLFFRPGFSSTLGRSARVIYERGSVLFDVAAIYCAVSFFLQLTAGTLPRWIEEIIVFLVGALFTVAIALRTFASLRGSASTDLSELAEEMRRILPRALGIMLLFRLGVMLGMMLVLIPGLIFWVKFRLAFWVALFEPDESETNCFRRASELATGGIGTLVGLMLFNLAGLLLMALPWYGTQFGAGMEPQDMSAWLSAPLGTIAFGFSTVVFTVLYHDIRLARGELEESQEPYSELDSDSSFAGPNLATVS